MSFGKQDNARCPFRGPVFRQPWGELTSDNLFSTFTGTLCSYPTNITALGLHEILGCPNVTIHPRPAQAFGTDAWADPALVSPYMAQRLDGMSTIIWISGSTPAREAASASQITRQILFIWNQMPQAASVIKGILNTQIHTFPSTGTPLKSSRSVLRGFKEHNGVLGMLTPRGKAIGFGGLALQDQRLSTSRTSLASPNSIKHTLTEANSKSYALLGAVTDPNSSQKIANSGFDGVVEHQGNAGDSGKPRSKRSHSTTQGLKKAQDQLQLLSGAALSMVAYQRLRLRPTYFL
ncbi:hypothetical protein PAXINDRAFT_182435 [Paxillus involutus ATCC 200175]|uniref:Uncharacterized protein n=1 Tax=Paxillus involutus ATCC 200175 TaxID=664439 RepID=A0A0C9TI53_PAXIN|nr:hypothetical protein PAXINDRAFT_182435 [Paxillus involutus ATCC 200175]